MSPPLAGFPSGQRGCAVNALALPSEVRILPPPSPPCAHALEGDVEVADDACRLLQRCGQAGRVCVGERMGNDPAHPVATFDFPAGTRFGVFAGAGVPALAWRWVGHGVYSADIGSAATPPVLARGCARCLL